jgi:hypothetical protein
MTGKMNLHLVRSIFTIALAKPLQCPFNIDSLLCSGDKAPCGSSVTVVDEVCTRVGNFVV